MALRHAEAVTTVDEVCRKLGVSQGTFFRWMKRFGSLGVPELRELRQLRVENWKLKQRVSDLSLDETILEEAMKGNSDARTAPCARSGGEGIVCPDGGPCVRRGRRATRERALQEHSTAPGRAARSDPRAGMHSSSSRLPNASRTATARGLAGEPQARLPALHRGESDAPAASVEAAPDGGGPARSAFANASERALGDGLHARPIGQRGDDPRADRDRRLYTGVRRAGGGEAAHRSGCGGRRVARVERVSYESQVADESGRDRRSRGTGGRASYRPDRIRGTECSLARPA